MVLTQGDSELGEGLRGPIMPGHIGHRGLGFILRARESIWMQQQEGHWIWSQGPGCEAQAGHFTF